MICRPDHVLSKGDIFQNGFSGDSGKQIYQYYIPPESGESKFSNFEISFCTGGSLFELQGVLSQVTKLQPNLGWRVQNRLLT